MSWIFSKRYKNVLNDENIKVSIPMVVRQRILYLFGEYNCLIDNRDKFGNFFQTDLFSETVDKLKTELGVKTFLIFSDDSKGNKHKETDKLEDIILKGIFPPNVFDSTELYYHLVNDSQNNFQKDINSIMEENHLPWRMADGKIFPIDSRYIEEEIIQKTHYLLREVKFQGALKEFEQARIDFTNRVYNSAIRNANLSYESTIKEILKVEKEKPGKLFEMLISSGYIPEYYKGFLRDFEKNILRCPSIIRNDEPGVGHGIGPSENIIPSELAELAINLTATLTNYLIKCYLNKESPDTLNQKKELHEEDEEDIPF